MAIMGYTDRLSVCPGEDVSLMVSSPGGDFSARLVRLIHGDHHPDGPGYKASPVSSELDGDYPGRRQSIALGSHLQVDALALPASVTVTTWFWPTALGPQRRGILGHQSAERGIALTIDEKGRIELMLGGTEVARSNEVATIGRWHFVSASIDARNGIAAVGLGALGGSMQFSRESISQTADDSTGYGERFQVGAWVGAAHFNGKLEDPTLFAGSLSAEQCERLHQDLVTSQERRSVIAQWNFGADIRSRVVEDEVGGHDGRLVNLPTRAVTGHRWTGKEVDFRLAPEQYRAIHFHDDDLDDAEWEASLTWTVPEDLESAVYGIELTCSEGEDVVPLFVRPPRGKATSRVALVMPTFSYLAYANAHVVSDPDARGHFESLGCEIEYPVQPQDVTILAERLHSLYDKHSDGSGVCHSSWLRPILTMRPKYHEPDLSLGRGAAHQLSADLHLVDWLYERREKVDILTDGDVHEEGSDLLSMYDVVITGTHPEYVSEAILDAYASYLDSGGRVMYLGGNGFYWVAELEDEERHTLEVRRWGASTRLWDARPGEWFLSASETLGGTWRFRGRAPQRIFGVGFTAQGSGKNRPYRRVRAGRSPEFAFVFAGLDGRDEIGAEPALVNEWGAAGYEIDRFDPELGSPIGTVVLATAEGFSDHYQHVVDEVLMADSRQGGSVNPLVRADMVLVPYPNKGAVFSPGSISWCSCLSFNNYKNDVAQITGNVLDRFLTDDVFPPNGRPGTA